MTSNDNIFRYSVACVLAFILRRILITTPGSHRQAQTANIRLHKPLLPWLAVVAFIAAPAWADWTLNNEQSQLSFISIKKGDVAEVHRFDQLSGSFGGKGNIELTIQLASVDTAIPIRDERMREMLFNTKAFPTASLSAKVDAAKVLDLDAVSYTHLTLPTSCGECSSRGGPVGE